MYQTDEQILIGLKTDPDKVLESLYKMYAGMVHHFILSNNGESDEAKDIYQESIIIFYEQVQSGKLVLQCKIKTYIYSIARRLWLKKLAAKKLTPVKIEDIASFVA